MMKIKRTISVVLLSLLVSIFQSSPAAKAAAPSSSSIGGSITCTGAGVATITFNISSNGGSAITSWEYSYDGTAYGTIPGASGNSGSYSVNSWYATSFSPYIRARNADGVNGYRNLGTCSPVTGGASSAPTVVSPANAPTGNAGSGQVLTSPLMFNSQPVAITSTYQWQRCTTADATSCSNIALATSSTYTAGADDVGKYLRTVVKGTSSLNPSQFTNGTSAVTAQISEAVPGTPGTPTAVAGDGEATITVVAPSSGGTPSSYTVTSSPAGATCTGSGTTYICTGLTNGTAYTFRTTATNGAGTSSASAASSSVTPVPPPPSITNVTSSTTNGSYNAGDVISIQVTFDQTVTVSGTPGLSLETGSTDQVANYTSGSGTNTLTFEYTIQAGDTSGDLTYVATNSLALNSGTIKNSTNSAATLTLPSPASTGSLAANKSFIVDTSAPTPSLTTASITSSDSATATSSEIGNAYLVKNSVTVSSLASITGADGALWNSVSISAADTNTNVPATGLVPGTYVLYVVDTAGNLSTVSTQTVTVALSAPGTPDLAASFRSWFIWHR
jgi:hypothetical protein